MTLHLKIRFFQSALDDNVVRSSPTDNVSDGVGLVLEGIEESIGVESLSVLDDSDEFTLVACQLIDVEKATLVTEGTEFFMMRSGRMLGRGFVSSS